MSDSTLSPERKGTRVTFLDQTGAKSVDAVIADTVTVKRILPNIITKMNLPVMGPDGQPMSYSLDHKEGGRRLREEQTLVDARVKDGDHLIVYPEIVAGGWAYGAAEQVVAHTRPVQVNGAGKVKE